MKSRLQIAANDFRTMLRRIASEERKWPEAQTCISIDNQKLVVHCPTAECAIPAAGSFDGQLRVAIYWLAAVQRAKFETDPIAIELDANELRLDVFKFECIWEPKPAEYIWLPYKASTRGLLRILRDNKLQDIEASGIINIVRSAEASTQKKAEKAARHLVEFGVSVAQIREVIERNLDTRPRL